MLMEALNRIEILRSDSQRLMREARNIVLE